MPEFATAVAKVHKYNSMATSVTNCTYEAQNNFSIGMIVSTLAETWTTQNKRAEEHVRNLTEVNVLADC